MSLVTDTRGDKSEPTGNPAVGYPQMCVRTNRTAQRTDMGQVIEKADEAADRFPESDTDDRAKAVTAALTEAFGSGNFGHTWIEFFNSDKVGDYTSFGYHEGYGFVKDGTASDTNDRPDRGFHVERCAVLTDPAKQPAELEKTIIPELNQESAAVAHAMGIPMTDPTNGAYTPVNNCAWFAVNLWNYATDDKFTYTQKFDGAAHADYWGMPFLKAVTEVADPGMAAESLSTTLPFTEGVDAAVGVPGSSSDVWLFRGGRYVRYNALSDKIIIGPKRTAEGWPGLL